MNPKSLFPVVLPSIEGLHEEFDFDFFCVDPLDKDKDKDAPISQWELVNPSDDEESYNHSDFDFVCYEDSYDPSDLDYVCYDVKDGSVVAVKFATLVEDSSVGDYPPLIDQYISSGANPDPSVEVKITGSLIAGNVDADGDGYAYRKEHDNDREDDDEEEEEYDDGLDDELVPRHMRGQFRRERIRKLGNRGCSKMNTSKKSPFLFVKRGCLHGKHCFGIGLKNSL